MWPSYQLLASGAPRWEAALVAFGMWAVIAAGGTALATAWMSGREAKLQGLRTSTSTTLPGTGMGDRALVAKAEKLLKSPWRSFEAPTVIRYESSQRLAPHYDANQGAAVEDSNRGGQTLATLLVYLNTVEKGRKCGVCSRLWFIPRWGDVFVLFQGGKTVFGKLRSSKGTSALESALEVNPRKGQALLFFPANAVGDFDDRLEHEGCEALDEKWIARIWRHAARVPPPYGLPDNYGDEFDVL